MSFDGENHRKIGVNDCYFIISSWYHGAITRIEAENILRPLNEGCFLVRNCESSRHDFSLSLK